MPNNVRSRITFDCSDEKLEEIVKRFGSIKNEETYFPDLNKIKPQPNNLFK